MLSDLLITTALHRPYVVAFLISFLVIGFLNRGLGRTLLFLSLGFSIAYLSEISSIRNGFPYGMYHYRYEAMVGEWIVWGVPLWDSASYAFMAYAAYEMGAFFIGPMGPIRLIGPILMVMLDIVADPLAVRGSRWFLGDIFYYPHGGPYFGVPLSNFAGWLLVAFCIFFSYDYLEKKFFTSPPPLRKPLFGPLFYWGILAFNFIITFWIGEWILGAVGLGMHLFSLGVLKLFKKSPDS